MNYINNKSYDDAAATIVPIEISSRLRITSHLIMSSAKAAPGEGKTEEASSSNQNANDARYYSFDPVKMIALQNEKPWMKQPNYFDRVALSPSAVTKMVMHCARGVKKGIAQGGNPIEVMGLLLGRPDPESPTCLIVTDAFPLPIEGFETRVIADDQDVVNHMINLTERLEHTRKEKFMGWYHSHPFDLGDHSHCFLSQTDLSTQLQWQRAEDPHGNPFVAIVVDPLRSTHTGMPELKAFRAFPPEYTSPVTNQCPDGTIEHSEQVRLEHWGSCWNRYYELQIEYYMSTASRQVLEQLTQNYLWTTTLRQPTTMQPEQIQTLQQIAAGMVSASSSNIGAAQGGPYTAAASADSSSAPATDMAAKEWEPAAEKIQKMATEELAKRSLKQVQQQVFPKGI
jgi:COP9 signalosome complex subunit 5